MFYTDLLVLVWGTVFVSALFLNKKERDTIIFSTCDGSCEVETALGRQNFFRDPVELKELNLNLDFSFSSNRIVILKNSHRDSQRDRSLRGRLNQRCLSER